ncbi:MAG TPA: helix-turn-helix domain-containing protein [Candidatus Bathyarchaeia archaeon]|nr:helix-turn-helix domain-containing protein [Candidatus Bathyarchaeia archaeon]
MSATTGTAYVGIRTDLHTYLSGATALAEGLSIRATGRLVRVDKDTVNHWLPVLGQHCQGVMNYFFRNLHLHECQLDELWTFIHKKEGHLTPLEKLAEVYGDAWVWIAFSPVYKVVPAWVVGKRTLRSARRLLFRLKSATDGYIPFFTSDELPHYANALLEVYGVWDTPPRQGTRGRFPKPRRYPPPDLCYAVVVKERARGRVVHVTTRLVYGTTEQVETALRMSPVSRTITTYGVERQNLTVRQHSRRMGRKVNAFSKDPDSLEEQLTVAFAYYHFVIPHRSLRQRLACPLPTKGGKGSYKKWKSVTPAMAAGLTDHVWTMDELLSFRVPPKSLWL